VGLVVLSSALCALLLLSMPAVGVVAGVCISVRVPNVRRKLNGGSIDGYKLAYAVRTTPLFFNGRNTTLHTSLLHW
jgi:hypothetical protein